MPLLTDIVVPIQIVIFLTTILLALIYSIPIIFIRRFHNVNNVFTANVCLATISGAAYWLSNLLIDNFFSTDFGNESACFAKSYFQLMCTIQVPYAVIVVYIHRLCSIVYYTKPFFKKKKWAIICISSQWTLGSSVSFIQASAVNSTCVSPNWLQICVFILVVIIPSLVSILINSIIFRYVRSSTNRVQPSSIDTHNNQQHFANRRDLRLLQHMIIMFCIFVGGWSPVYLYPIFSGGGVNEIVLAITMILAELALLLDILDLYLYNHELRRYLQDTIFKCH